MSVDDPHDAFNPVVRDGVWWCKKHNEDAETCGCGRGDGIEVAVFVIGGVIITLLIIAAFLVL